MSVQRTTNLRRHEICGTIDAMPRPKPKRRPTSPKAPNRSLSAAKAAKHDEFYPQYVDIQKEVVAYLEYDHDTFRKKTVYCNCDDPFESHFFKYFAANFNQLGFKRLICTSYDVRPLPGTRLSTNTPLATATARAQGHRRHR